MKTEEGPTGYKLIPEFLPTSPPTERGTGRWNIRRILIHGVAGAAVIPIGALLLTKFLNIVEITPQTIIDDMGLKAVLGWQALCGGATAALLEVRRQQNKRKILASS